MELPFLSFRELDANQRVRQLADPHRVLYEEHLFPIDDPDQTYLGLAMHDNGTGEQGSVVVARVGEQRTVFVAQFLYALALVLEARLNAEEDIRPWLLPLLRLRHRGANPEGLAALHNSGLLLRQHHPWNEATLAVDAPALAWSDVAFMGYLLGLSLVHTILMKGYGAMRTVSPDGMAHVAFCGSFHDQCLTLTCCKQYAGALLYAWEVTERLGLGAPEICLNAALDCAAAMVHQPVMELALPSLFYNTLVERRPEALQGILALAAGQGEERLVSAARKRIAPLLIGIVSADLTAGNIPADHICLLAQTITTFDTDIDPAAPYAVVQLLNELSLLVNIPLPAVELLILQVQSFGAQVTAELASKRHCTFVEFGLRQRLADAFNALVFALLPRLGSGHPLQALCLSLTTDLLETTQECGVWRVVENIHKKRPLAAICHSDTVGITAEQMARWHPTSALLDDLRALEVVRAEQEDKGRVCALMSSGLMDPIALPTHLPNELTKNLTPQDQERFLWFLAGAPLPGEDSLPLQAAMRTWVTQDLHLFNRDVLLRYVYKEHKHPLTSQPLEVSDIVNTLDLVPRLQRAAAEVSPGA